jgi:hypothetical protein
MGIEVANGTNVDAGSAAAADISTGDRKDQFAKSWRRNELQPEHPRSSPLLSHVHELNFGRFPPRPSELPASRVIV